MIRVTVTRLFSDDDNWGMDDTYESGGEEAVIAVACEDIQDFIDGATWEVREEIE